MKKLTTYIFLVLLSANASAANFEGRDKVNLCRYLAGCYVQGLDTRWIETIAEIRKRGYGFECKEIAELRMSAKRWAVLPSFKIKLDELFGKSPQLSDDGHFLNEKQIEKSQQE